MEKRQGQRWTGIEEKTGGSSSDERGPTRFDCSVDVGMEFDLIRSRSDL